MECKFHTLLKMEYCYLRKGSWILAKCSHHVCCRVLSLIFLRCRFNVNVNVKSRLSGVGSILYFRLICIDDMPVITESRIVQYQNLIYIGEAGIKDFGRFWDFSEFAKVTSLYVETYEIKINKMKNKEFHTSDKLQE